MATRPELEDFAHDHNFLGSSHDANARRTIWVVALTSVMMVGEIIAGSITGSMALLADGFHMATHAGALGVAALAYVYARRHATNRRFSFGTGKVGDLAGFASAMVLGLIAIGIAIESGLRLLTPTSVAFREATMIAVLGLIVNVVSALLLSAGHAHGHGHGHSHGHDHADHSHGPTTGGKDNNFRSAYVHVLADTVTSVLAIGALLAGRYLGLVWLDPVMGIVGAVVIASWALTLMRDTAGILLDQTDLHIADEVRDLIERDGARLVDLHVWRIGPEAHAAIVSVAGTNLDREAVRRSIAPVHELRHITIECLPA